MRSRAIPRSVGKAERANDVLRAADLALSVQVLQEFYVQATRASRADPLTHEQGKRLVESFLRLPGPGAVHRCDPSGAGHA